MSQLTREIDLQISAPENDRVVAAARSTALGAANKTSICDTSGHRSLLFFALVATYITYFQTLEFLFVYDDGPQIVNSPFIKSWHFVPRYFATHVWGWLPYVPANYYRPVFLIWLRLNHALFDLRPFWWHLTGVGLHLTVSFLVYLLAAKVSRDRTTGAIAALIFGVYPCHVEVVAWVSGVTESLLALLLVLAFLCYLRSREDTPNVKRFLWASLLLYGLALLTKETAIVLPILIVTDTVLKDVVTSSQSKRYRTFPIRSYIGVAGPYLAISVGYLLIRSRALHGFYHPQAPLPMADMLWTIPGLLWWYLRHLIWPHRLSCFYDFFTVETPGLRSFVFPLFLLLLLAVVSWVGWRRTRSRTLMTALMWILVPLLPLLNFSVFFSQDVVHDRYLYLPSIGFSILVAAGLRRAGKAVEGLVRSPLLPAATLLGIVLSLVIATKREYQPWRENLPLFVRAVQVAPNNPYAAANLAGVLAASGSFGEAEAQYKQIIRRHPDFWFGYYGLGQMYYRAHRPAEAVPLLERAAALTSYEPEPSYYLGLAQMELGHLEGAATALQKALRLYPTGPDYNYSLGLVRRKQGKEEQALEDFKAELASHPDNAKARDQLRAD